MKDLRPGWSVTVKNTKYPDGVEGTVVDYSPDRGLVCVKMKSSGKNDFFLERDVERKQ
jgi:hypothetical protein